MAAIFVKITYQSLDFVLKKKQKKTDRSQKIEIIYITFFSKRIYLI